MNGQAGRINGRTPAIALIVAITSLIPAVTGLVTAMRDSGEDDARMAYQLLVQRLEFIEKQMDESEAAYVKEIEDLEDDLDDVRDMTRRMVLWLDDVEAIELPRPR